MKTQKCLRISASKKTSISFVVFSTILLVSFSIFADKEGADRDLFTIAQIHYHGGGDWYQDRTSMPRLQKRFEQLFGIPAMDKRVEIELTDDDLFSYPMLFMTGHGNIVFSPEEAARLRQYLMQGGFLWASDDYGMDTAFRREMKKVFPDRDLVELPFDHEIYHIFYDFPKGLPKIHEHAGGPPHGYGVFIGDRLAVFYDFNTDIGDGLEAPSIHNDPEEKREDAFRMAINIVLYAIKN
ncbi:MAG: DUF4159 domain-containing protein [bacterium]